MSLAVCGSSACDSRTQRVQGTVMGDTFPNHNNNSLYRNPTFYYIGTLDPLGKGIGAERAVEDSPPFSTYEKQSRKAKCHGQVI